jgi:hypothetical protein
VAVKNRSTRIRQLAITLSQKFGLDSREWIEPRYDDSTRQWTLSWHDGPTVDQVRRAARKADKEITEDLRFERRYTPRAFALGAIRMALAGEEVPRSGGWYAASVVEAALEKVPNPGPKGERETMLAERLLAKACAAYGREWVDDHDICGLVGDRGLAWLLTPAEDGGNAPAMSPLEVLTARYADGAAGVAWRAHLRTLPVGAAFSAALADPRLTPEAAAAALALMPEVRAELDAAEELLTALARGDQTAGDP